MLPKHWKEPVPPRAPPCTDGGQRFEPAVPRQVGRAGRVQGGTLLISANCRALWRGALLCLRALPAVLHFLLHQSPRSPALNAPFCTPQPEPGRATRAAGRLHSPGPAAVHSRAAGQPGRPAHNPPSVQYCGCPGTHGGYPSSGRVCCSGWRQWRRRPAGQPGCRVCDAPDLVGRGEQRKWGVATRVVLCGWGYVSPACRSRVPLLPASLPLQAAPHHRRAGAAGF